MSDKQYTAALDLLRRLDPDQTRANVANLISLEPELAEDLLAAVDTPLTVQKDPHASHREFLCCDYNRDIDSYRSPWSNEYVPELTEEDAQESPFPSDPLRQLEVLCNDSFDVYRDLYYEGGISSVYLWDLEDSTDGDFAGVVLFKKTNVGGEWDSIHVVEVTAADESRAVYNYKVTTTVILQLRSEKQNGLALSGNLTRQLERDAPVAHAAGDSIDAVHVSHVANLGQLVEDVESQTRNLLDTVYFEKTKDVLQQVRLANAHTAETQLNKKQHQDVIRGLQNL
ncbi:F-actin-capping protein subunit beta KNAG_0H02850 [Huiozyma naganishii CBS 8797]|uniref:F-actin-capping protein subunit beta n=1 Tax=Huiozyma naganishii (strain ATCC MYA-139 / BCRC 22969 / CBS 8797 / KCTC 17520 / NBRC 10181 / NCYC 3082 / Yp74L-3) TaxID=1071383 RepID=J7R9Z7_HUIN7|nr:hypothetical protein KNAG_0H02850 [Kazachstania naganishii CBS 8797]CCK71700.1 hypothetical protein KNAG_0H02850 [Kazachstania naganishii CBS 8797]